MVAIKIGKSKKLTKTRPRTVLRVARSKSSTKSSSSPFSTVSAISTAPVSIGNSIQGTAPIVVPIKDGVTVLGRDFCFTADGTGSTNTGWCMVGGIPLTPASVITSVLRGFEQMYARFKVNYCVFHYITSSPTSTNGDVVFYYSKDPLSPLPDTEATTFLPFIVSDGNSVMGPQWTNNSVRIQPVGSWKYTDYALNSDQQAQSYGDLILYSKTSSTDSPGYVLFDYSISFKQLQVNPRASFLPVTRSQWISTNLYVNGTVTTANVTQWGNAATILLGNTGTNDITGTGAALIPGISNGDIYRVVLASVTAGGYATYAGVSTPTAATSFVYKQGVGGFQSATAIAGMVWYVVVSSTRTADLHLTLEGAFANAIGDIPYFGVTNAGGTTINFPVFAKLVGTQGASIAYNP